MRTCVISSRRVSGAGAVSVSVSVSVSGAGAVSVCVSVSVSGAGAVSVCVCLGLCLVLGQLSNEKKADDTCPHLATLHAAPPHLISSYVPE